MDIQLISLCKNLLQDKYPRDDTLFEKLVSAMNKNENEWTNLADCKDFTGVFVECIAKVPTIDPMCLSGLLRIFGVLFEKNIDIFKSQPDQAGISNSDNVMVVILLKCFNCSHVQENKSVANAVLFCMQKMYLSFERLVEFFCDEFWAFLQRCLQDGSVFIVNSATNLFADLILLCYMGVKKNGNQYNIFDLEEQGKNISSTNDQEKSIENVNHFKVLKIFITYLNSSNPNDVSLVLQVVNAILDKDIQVNVLEDFVNGYNIPEAILACMTHLESSGLKCDVDIFIKLMKLNCLEDIPKKLFAWLNRLVAEKQYCAAVKVCSCLLHMHTNQKEKVSLEENVVKYLKTILEKSKYSRDTKLLFQCFSLFPSLQMYNLYAVETICDYILNLRDNKKVVKLCIRSLSLTIQKNNLTDVSLYRALNVCCILVETNTDVLVISTCFQSITSIVKQVSDDRANRVKDFMPSLRSLGELLPEKVLNIKWEIRDSALEFLGNLALNMESRYITDWLSDHNFLSCMWENITDGESYVRASAIVAIAKWFHNPMLKRLILNKYAREAIVQKIIDILTNDTEAFARRACVDLISIIIQLDDFETLKPILMAAINKSINDLDWEVKMRTLAFWENLINNYAPAQEEGNVNGIQQIKEQFCTLVKIGCFDSLFIALEDFDEVVQSKSKSIIIEYKVKLMKSDINNITYLDMLPSEIKPEDHVMFTKVLGKILEETKDHARSENDYDENIVSLLSDILVSLDNSSRKEDDDSDNVNASMLDCY